MPETTTPEKYRFDRPAHTVYEYSEDAGAYLYIGGYINFGIKPSDSKKQMIRRVDAFADPHEGYGGPDDA